MYVSVNFLAGHAKMFGIYQMQDLTLNGQLALRYSLCFELFFYLALQK